MANRRTHTTRAARTLQANSALSYQQALEVIRRLHTVPTDTQLADTEFLATLTANGDGPTEVFARALQSAWNDMCADSGSIPDAFSLHGGGVAYATFAGVPWVAQTLNELARAGYTLERCAGPFDTEVLGHALQRAWNSAYPADGAPAGFNLHSDTSAVTATFGGSNWVHLASLYLAARGYGIAPTGGPRFAPCDRCGEPADDGEGWNGLCGSCADIAETTCTHCGRRVEETGLGEFSHADTSPGPMDAHTHWWELTSAALDADHPTAAPIST